jgi:hypothetical protein
VTLPCLDCVCLFVFLTFCTLIFCPHTTRGDIDDYKWHDLEEEQLEAARELGWDKVSWDEKYEHQSWGQLPEHVKMAARKLGFNKDQWDDEEDGKGWESWEKEWGDFTPEEKRCMHVLGWYKHTWG